MEITKIYFNVMLSSLYLLITNREKIKEILEKPGNLMTGKSGNPGHTNLLDL